MTITINVYEAKTQLSSLLNRAEAGEEIIIARIERPDRYAGLCTSVLTSTSSIPRTRSIGRRQIRVRLLVDDRMLVAQARIERLTVITAVRRFADYQIDLLT